MALVAPTYQHATQEPMYLDPVLLVAMLLFLVQALVFLWLGSCWGHRGQRALELRLKVTGDKLRLVEINSERLKRMEATYQQHIARADAAAAAAPVRERPEVRVAGLPGDRPRPAMPKQIYTTKTGDKAHLSRARCPSLHNAVDLRAIEVCLHCLRLGPDP